MLLRLLAAFCLIPLVELALLLWIASRTSWQLTLILVIATGILGAWLARQQGWRTWVRARERLERGQFPMDALGDGISVNCQEVRLAIHNRSASSTSGIRQKAASNLSNTGMPPS